MRIRRVKKNRKKGKKDGELIERLAIANAELRVARRENLGLFILVLLLIAVLLFFFVSMVNNGFVPGLNRTTSIIPRVIPRISEGQNNLAESFIMNDLGNVSGIGNVSVSRIYVPAVDKDGNGVVTVIIVEAMQGYGRTLVDINDLLYWADTQSSIRTAREVAQDVTGINVSSYDLIYHIYANASVVGGPSAGSAITIATIAALTNKTLNKNVSITGTINHDGTLGPIGDALAKAKAAKQAGIKTFIVPLTQSKDVMYETKKYCKNYGLGEFCVNERIPKKVEVGSEAGINIIEVENIKEAMKYFLL